MKAQSDKLAGAGDYNGAMELRWQMLDFDSPKVSNLGALTFYATQSLALDDIGGIAAHLDADSSRKYAAQLLAMDEQLFSLTQVLENQKAEELKQLRGISRSSVEWKKAINGLDFSATQRATLRQIPVAQIEGNITTFYDEALARVSQPYVAQPSPIAVDLDPYSSLYATRSVARRFVWARAKTERLLLVAALQDRADRLEKIARAAPLPDDPFGGGPLREKDGAIYSVGPDTVDDGGQSVPNPDRTQASDKGDILAPLF